MRQYLRMILCAWLLAASARGAYEIQLASGWNLVSLPEQQTNTDIEFVTASIRGKFSAVWGYEGEQWSGYFPAEGASTLARMDAGRAYWIFMMQPGSLVGAGMRPASTLTLTPGWNFVGHNAAVTKTPAEVFGTSAAVIEAVQGYEVGAWRTFVPGATGNTLTQLAPGRGYWVKARATSVANFGLTLNPRLRVLSDTALATVTQVSATSVTLASTQAAGIAAGDVLAAGISARTPVGLLRRVSAVNSSGSLTTLTTTGAAFTDAVTDGVLGFSLPLADQSTVAALAADLGPGERAELRTVERAALAGGGTFPLQVIILTLNRDVLLNSVPVRVTGEIFFEPSLSLNYDIAGLRVRSLRVAAQGRESLSLSFQASQSVSGSVTWKIFEKSLPSKLFFVGGLPVVITPKISIPVTLSGSFGTTASASLRQDATALVGLRYDTGDGFAPIRELQNTFTLSNTSSVTYSASVTAGVSILLEAYGIVGPYAGVNAGLSLEAQAASNISTWGIYGVVGGEVGFEVGADLGFWKLETSLSYALPFEFVRHRLYPPSSLSDLAAYLA